MIIIPNHKEILSQLKNTEGFSCANCSACTCSNCTCSGNCNIKLINLMNEVQ